MSIVYGTTAPRLHLYDPTGVTWIADLENARGIQWQHGVSRVGSITFEVPLSDSTTASIVHRSIVKLSIHGAIRTGCVIDLQDEAAAVDGNQWLRFDTQPGLLSLLADGIVLPEYGLKRKSPTDRIFGFMSADGPWRVTADWDFPLGYHWSAETTVRKNYPPELRVPDPYWIAVISPATSQSANVLNWFTCDFTVAAAVDVSFDVTADNYLTLYLDGEEIATPDHAEAWGWRTVQTIPASLAAGDHRLAAKVQNTDGVVAGAGPMGLIGNLYTLGVGGKRNGTQLQTNLTDWICTATQPGWLRAQVIKKLVDEAVAAGAIGPGLLTLGFTDTHDSNGDAYTDTHAEYVIACDVNLTDAALQMAEAGIDIEVDAATMTLNAWVRWRSDLSATVELKLGDAGGSLKNYETTSAKARYTDVYARLADNTYAHTVDSAAVTALGGHIQVGLQLGSASDAATATALSQAQLAHSAHTVITVVAEASSLTGPQAYVDYHPGSTIKGPGHRTGTMKERVMSLTGDASGELVRIWPDQLELDLSV